MASTIRARYENGRLTPLEPLDLHEGAEVEVSVESASASGRGGPVGVAETPATYDAGSPAVEPASEERNVLDEIIEAAEELRKSIPDEAWDVLPTDGAMNKKHYLYGHPKEVEFE